MRATQPLRLLRTALRPRSAYPISYRYLTPQNSCRYFQSFAALQKTQTHTLSDIGEGVKEVQIIQWFVEEGAAVEEWAPLCEVQSDKASVEITSKYSGVVKKLHFDRDAIVQVGDAMLDIEVEGEGDEEGGEEQAESDEPESKEAQEAAKEEHDAARHEEETTKKAESEPPKQEETKREDTKQEEATPKTTENKGSAPGGSAGLATPAVRGMLKEHGLEITEITGTGRDGRVLKEDVLKHVENGKQQSTQAPKQPQAVQASKPELDAKQVETTQNLTPVQSAMFKTMTKSLSIPHFLFSDTLNVTGLGAMRGRLNAARNPETTPKYSYLPFVVKAVSLALNQYPLLNGRLDLTDANKPKVVLRSNHNIGIAMDTPSGLLVPVIKNVNARSITSIAQEIHRLSQLGHAGKLSNSDLSGGTITVSNIGNIGGETLAPVIVDSQLAILGIGKIKPTPVFAADGKTVERADLMSTSWSADHRVVDGATMARMARVIQKYIEEPETMLVDMS